LLAKINFGDLEGVFIVTKANLVLRDTAIDVSDTLRFTYVIITKGHFS